MDAKKALAAIGKKRVGCLGGSREEAVNRELVDWPSRPFGPGRDQGILPGLEARQGKQEQVATANEGGKGEER